MHGKDDGEERGHTDCDQRPYEEECSAGTGDPARETDTLSLHVDKRNNQRKERQK